jgi:DNA polymerase-1
MTDTPDTPDEDLGPDAFMDRLEEEEAAVGVFGAVNAHGLVDMELGQLPPGFEMKTGRPQILIAKINFATITDGTLAILAHQNVRAPEDAQIFTGPEGPTRLRRSVEGRLHMNPLSIGALRYEIANVIDTIVIGQSGPMIVPPSAQLVDAVRTHSNPGFLRLTGITRSPLMLPDGMIIARDGYDEATHSYVDLPTELHGITVPDKPTVADIRNAAEILRVDILGDFLWGDNEGHSLANAIGFLMTPVLQSMFTGRSPLFAIVGNQQGSGKTLLAQLAAIISTGAEAVTSPLPGDTNELRKQITATLRTSPTVVVLDNVSGMIVKSPELARMITSNEWGDRILGVLIHAQLPNKTTWCLNGNAVMLGGDIQRRTVPIHIGVNRPDPWNRGNFTHPDLKGWVLEHRVEILQAIFTIARAWVVDGRPAPEHGHGGGFEDWARTIGGILDHASIRGHLANQATAWDLDYESENWTYLLQHLIDNGWGEGTFTARQLLTDADRKADGLLGDLLADVVSRALTAKSLGETLMAHRGRRYFLEDGRAAGFDPAGKAHDNVRAWIIRISEPTSSVTGP